VAENLTKLLTKLIFDNWPMAKINQEKKGMLQAPSFWGKSHSSLTMFSEIKSHAKRD
jgi:hypothetical protein